MHGIFQGLMIPFLITSVIWADERSRDEQKKSIPLEFSVEYRLAEETETTRYSLKEGVIYIERIFVNHQDNNPAESFERRGIWRMPSEAEWQQFRRVVDEVDACHWEKEYLNLNSLDAIYRAIRVVYDDCTINSKSYNHPFPHHPQMLKGVEQLLDARMPLDSMP